MTVVFEVIFFAVIAVFITAVAYLFWTVGASDRSTAEKLSASMTGAPDASADP